MPAVYENSAAEILDLDGNIHELDSEQDARFWLLEDEYSSLANLKKDGHSNLQCSRRKPPRSKR